MATPIPTGITLETVLYNGPSRDKKNLLFLGDGFAAADRTLFDTTITEVVARFFRKAPFSLRGFRNEFNIFKAFTPSTSSGITCDVPVDINGLTIGDNSGAGASIGIMTTKISSLGLRYGCPISGSPMPRLICAKVGDENLIMNFMASLSLPSEGASQTAIPECWAEPPANSTSLQGKDRGLVIVMVNDDKYGGGGGINYAMVTLGESTGFLGLATIGSGITDHTPATPRNNYNKIYSIAIHELGHSHFRLMDDYGEVHTPGVATTVGHFDGRPNAITRADVLNGAGQFDPSKIKWYKEVYSGSTDKIISTTAFNYMNTNQKPLWERPAGTNCATLPYDGSVKYPPISVRGTVRYPQRIIGAYEGGGREKCGTYKPSGSCRMLSVDIDADFCYVCKHAIVEKVNTSYLQALFTRFYPR